jgi:small subunit ribosomal protein S17
MSNKENTRNIGIPGIESPKETCNDCNCPFHGNVGVRGRTYVGNVISKKASKTAVVGWVHRLYAKKYERFETRKSKVFAHAPDCLHIKKDDLVLIGECRPLSKTKKFVVIKKLEAKQ